MQQEQVITVYYREYQKHILTEGDSAHLFHASQFAKCFPIWLHQNLLSLIEKLLLNQYRWREWGSEKLNDLAMIS
jgi:hypothetical protein